MPSAMDLPAAKEQRPSIAIIGSGIGGLALAIGLLSQNINCTIYEAASEFSAVGAGVGLGPNAIRAINGIDSRLGNLYNTIKTGNKSPERVHDMFEALYAEEGFGLKRGWTGGSISMSIFQRSSAHRKDLLDIMASFISKDIIQFKKRLSKVVQVDKRVKLLFENGETAEFDAVIGCDGIKSVARQAVLQENYPQNVVSQYTGVYVYRAVIDMEDACRVLGTKYAEDCKWFMAPGRSFTSYPISKGRELNLVCFVQDKKPWSYEQVNIEVTREEMLEDFQGFDSRLLALLEYVKPVRWPLFHHKDTPIYYNGHICLLGDAAHATTPFQASGAGQALEDAHLLSKLLGLVKTPDHLELAYQVYDSIRRPRANRIVQTSEEAGLIYCQCHPDIGDNMEEIVANGNARVPWIWTHDLDADVERAKRAFRALVEQSDMQSEKGGIVEKGTFTAAVEEVAA